MLIVHHKISKNLSFLVLLSGILFLNIIGIKHSLAGDEEKLIGSWRGRVIDKPIGVDMTIDSVKGKQANNKFHYSEPRACKLDAEYLYEEDSKHWFVLKNGTGNICRSKLNAGHLIIELKSANELSYKVTYKGDDSDDDFPESGQLKRD